MLRRTVAIRSCFSKLVFRRLWRSYTCTTICNSAPHLVSSHCDAFLPVLIHFASPSPLLHRPPSQCLSLYLSLASLFPMF